MLFDLRGRGRRNVIKVIYLGLAVLMGGGLVLFGIGGNSGDGGLVDAFTGANGAEIGAERYEKEISDARAQLQTDDSNETAWVELIRAQVSLAATDDQYDSVNGTYNEAGQADLQEAVASWEDYQAIDPKDTASEGRVASIIVRAYLSLEDLEGAIGAQEVVALDREAVGPYSSLAQYAYLAGQTRKGDLAAQKAIELEEPDQRDTLRNDLEALKAQAAPQAVPSVVPSATPTASEKSGDEGKAKDAKPKPSEQSKK